MWETLVIEGIFVVHLLAGYMRRAACRCEFSIACFSLALLKEWLRLTSKYSVVNFWYSCMYLANERPLIRQRGLYCLLVDNFHRVRARIIPSTELSQGPWPTNIQDVDLHVVCLLEESIRHNIGIASIERDGWFALYLYDRRWLKPYCTTVCTESYPLLFDESSSVWK